jgi:Ca2+-binding RTX toxin-like protein
MPKSHRQEMIQSLESRVMLAVDLDGTILKVTGTGEEDVVTVALSSNGQSYVVTVNGDVANPVSLDDVSRIEISTGADEDEITLSVANGNFPDKVIIKSGKQDDIVTAYTGRKNRILGGGGADTLSGRGLIKGGSGDDEITGSIKKDFIFGGPGVDHIDAEEGNDVVFGGAGNDSLEGDEGDDTVFGEKGDDHITGGTGEDHLYGNAGQDFLEGEDDLDTLFGGLGDDVVHGDAPSGTPNDSVNFGEEDGIEELISSLKAAGNDFA